MQGAYRLAGILRIVGENPIEIDAGLYNLTQTTPPGPPPIAVPRARDE